MHIEEHKFELINFLRKEYKKPKVVVMPDFFFDRIINVKDNLENFSSKITKIIKQNGGSLDGMSQMDFKGGNAINTASALITLGAKVTPIICTNENGGNKIRSYLKNETVDLSHIKIGKKASITTALEFDVKNKKINIMLRDLGDLANFKTSNLTNRDYLIIDDADYVCLFNWAGTKKYGTELAKKVFSRVKKKGKGKTYYDTADPNSNSKEIPKLLKNVLKSSFVDILSLNENEAISYASFFDKNILDISRKKPNNKAALQAAKILAKNLTARIDLHTSSFAASLTKKKETCIATFNIKPLRVTGAGDAWNAGNILADTNLLSDKSRLMLANAISACYLTDPQGNYPTQNRLIEFLEKN